jgi:hypothetical protein
MAFFEQVPWTNPWAGNLSKVINQTVGGFDYYLASDTTYIATYEPFLFHTWQIGLLAAEVKVYLTLAVGNTVTVIIDDDNGVIGGDVLVLGAGSHVLTFPIVGQTADLSKITLQIPGADDLDVVTNIEVIPGVPTLSEFWTDFVKSYEIP